MWIGHRQEIGKLTFRWLALRRRSPLFLNNYPSQTVFLFSSTEEKNTFLIQYSRFFLDF